MSQSPASLTADTRSVRRAAILIVRDFPDDTTSDDLIRWLNLVQFAAAGGPDNTQPARYWAFTDEAADQMAATADRQVT